MLYLIEKELKELVKDEIIGGHNHEHFAAVRDHSIEAVKLEDELSATQKLQVILASYLHDADDHKIFPQNKNYENEISSVCKSCDEFLSTLSTQIVSRQQEEDE